jgi:hypothetical protein
LFGVFQHLAEGLFFLLRGVLFEPLIKVLIAEAQISTSTFRINGLIRHSTLLNGGATSLGLRSGSETIQHQIAEYRIGEDESATVPSDKSGIGMILQPIIR